MPSKQSHKIPDGANEHDSLGAVPAPAENPMSVVADMDSDGTARRSLGDEEEDSLSPRGSLRMSDSPSLRGALTQKQEDGGRWHLPHGLARKNGTRNLRPGGLRLRIRRRIWVATACLVIVLMCMLACVIGTASIQSASSSGNDASNTVVPRRQQFTTPRVSADYEGLSELVGSDGGEEGGTSAKGSDKWVDNLIYIQWGFRPEACWPIQIKTPQEVECGSVAIILAAIILSGDYTLTPNSVLDAMQAKYGAIAPNEGYDKFLRYIDEEYGVHHKNLGHITADQAREILEKGHLIQVGEGCDGRYGLPFCKAKGVQPRCCHGHTILFYKYADGYFWAKDSAPSDGAAMCLYPEGPLTVTHHGAANGRCSQNGKTVSYDNYADEFLKNGWCVELWSDDPAQGPKKKPDSVPEPSSSDT